jgi:hypothetical protein
VHGVRPERGLRRFASVLRSTGAAAGRPLAPTALPRLLQGRPDEAPPPPQSVVMALGDLAGHPREEPVEPVVDNRREEPPLPPKLL